MTSNIYIYTAVKIHTYQAAIFKGGTSSIIRKVMNGVFIPVYILRY